MCWLFQSNKPKRNLPQLHAITNIVFHQPHQTCRFAGCRVALWPRDLVIPTLRPGHRTKSRAWWPRKIERVIISLCSVTSCIAITWWNDAVIEGGVALATGARSHSGIPPGNFRLWTWMLHTGVYSLCIACHGASRESIMDPLPFPSIAFFIVMRSVEWAS